MIFLHGLGDSANGFLDVFNEQEWTTKNTRIVLPTAPYCAVTMNDGFQMNSWFDIYSLNAEYIDNPHALQDVMAQYNQKDLIQSASLLNALIL